MKKKKYITVEGVPCEVLEENTESGIVQSTGDASPWEGWGNRPLVVAPDGSLVLPNPFALYMVDPTQPDEFEMERHLRSLAKEMR